MWLEIKYINLLSSRFERFTKNKNNFRLRCPYCGDSKKSRTKARGHILYKNNKFNYYCHNCHKSLSFQDFLKDMNTALYYEYIKELIVEKGWNKKATEVKNDEPPKPKTSKINIKKISDLSINHPARKYIEKRKIPEFSVNRLYYTPKFKTWVNSVVPDKFTDEDIADEPRLIIPFFNKEGKMFGFQGRSFDNKSEIKYISIMIDENMPKIYGLDLVDFSKKVYAFEGPIDSMFIKNSIASAGGKIETDLTDDRKHNIVIVYDNEPRKIDTIKRIESAINKGFKVCIWPNYIQQKDINEMVLCGLDPQKIIDENIYNGLSAKLALSKWRKV